MPPDSFDGGAVVVLFAFACEESCEPNHLILFSGEAEDVLRTGEWGLQHTPDGHVSYFRTGGDYHVWLTAGNEGHHLSSIDLGELIPTETAAGRSIPVLGPSGEGFDAHYAGPGSVIRSSDGRGLLMFYHAEDWDWSDPGGMPEGTYYASIGLARSFDGGRKWERIGPIITGRDPKPDRPVRFANGAGLPCAVVAIDGFIYLYYTDWPTGMGMASGPDEIHVARSPISSDGTPGSWRKYYRGSFDEPGLFGDSQAVIERPNPTALFAASASVSFNVFLDAYLAVFLADDGFYHASSQDGIQWTSARPFFPFPRAHSELETGDPWYIYPTLLSPSQADDTVTGGTGYLFFAEGVFDVSPHHMVRRPVRLIRWSLRGERRGEWTQIRPQPD